MYELHRLGWNSFQQLCLTIAREILGQTVQSFLDSNDAGRDGAFAGSWTPATGEHLNGEFVIQCKHSCKANYLLTKSDMTDEMPKVHKLVADGLCDVYILMTNAGVSGKQEAMIKADLVDAGAKHVLIYGATWIEDQIKENNRLRMLVPRVYGLGDLSQILDARAYGQARAVLESLREDLAKVVITDSYRKAVNALDEHGFVLLIGEPAAGKTTIASMLAMAAADKWKSSVLKLIWLTVVKRNKFPTQLFFSGCSSLCFQGTQRGGTYDTTVDHSDIRGLGTARLVFVVELPLSSCVSSTKGLIQ